MDHSPQSAAPTASHVPAHAAGARIGPYRLLQAIGEGGMGVVYMAEQEQPVRRRVALKIIKPGMDSAHIVARFRAEQQALALMDHQNIAKVHDAGVTEQGLPYFVMELVHGVPITKYCDDNKLTPNERLALFIPVCRAVQHAHQKGIIHRDLKPSNVLVCLYDGKPVAKVIDFGVAKAMEQPLTDGTMFTQFGQVIGTLEYMSPEQAEMNQLGVDTRSDIYSLGVMLYELLTGSTPLERARIKQAAFDEVLKRIREEDPPPPSSRLSSSTETLPIISKQRSTDPAQLARMLRGELDWIVMKSLEKDRTRRYDSASGFAQDIERYLADEPVEACPPSATYRLRKYASKHRALLATMAAFAVILLAGTGISVWQAIRATQAEGIADKARNEANHDRDVAKKLLRQVETERETAVQATKDALLAQKQLKEAGDKLRRSLYAADMTLVRGAWDADRPERVAALLKGQAPQGGEPDLRGFEWHFWNRQLESQSGVTPLEQFPQSSIAWGTIGPPIGPPSKFRSLAEVFAFSASGKYCAALTDTKVAVWKTETGKPVRTIPYTPSPRFGRKISVPRGNLRDDRILLRAGTDEEPELIDVVSGKTLLQLPNSVLHADGKQAVATREDEIVWLDLETGEKTIVECKGISAAPIFSDDRSRVAWWKSGENVEDAKLHIADTKTGAVVGNLDVKRMLPSLFVFPADGKRLIVRPQRRGLNGDGPWEFSPLEIWDVDTGKQLWTKTIAAAKDDPILAVSPDGRILLVREHSNHEGHSYLVDTSKETKVTPILEAPTTTLSSRHSPLVIFSPCGRLVTLPRELAGFSTFSTSTGQKVFDAKTASMNLPPRAPLGPQSIDANSAMRYATYTSDGRQFLLKVGPSLYSWDTTNWFRSASLPASASGGFFSPVKGSGSMAGRYRRLDKSGQLLLTLEHEDEKADQGDRRLLLRSTDDGRILQSRGPFPDGTAISGFDDSHRVVLVVPMDDRQEVRLLDLATDRSMVLQTLDKATPASVRSNRKVRTVALADPVEATFLADRGQILLMTGYKFADMPDLLAGGKPGDAPSKPGPSPAIGAPKMLGWPHRRGRFSLADARSGKRVPSGFDAIDDGLNYSLSADGKTIAILRSEVPKKDNEQAVNDKPPCRALVADLESARVICELDDLSRSASEIALSPDGSLLAINQTIYDARTGKMKFKVASNDVGRIGPVFFSPDSRRLIALKMENRTPNGWIAGVRLFDVHEGNEVAQIPFQRGGVGLPVFTPDGRRMMALRFDWQTLPAGSWMEVIDAAPPPGAEPAAKAANKGG